MIYVTFVALTTLRKHMKNYDISNENYHYSMVWKDFRVQNEVRPQKFDLIIVLNEN